MLAYQYTLLEEDFDIRRFGRKKDRQAAQECRPPEKASSLWRRKSLWVSPTGRDRSLTVWRMKYSFPDPVSQIRMRELIRNIEAYEARKSIMHRTGTGKKTNI